MTTILVIDDNYDIIHFVELILQAEGFRVFTARDGREALQQFYMCTPDIVISDVNLPHLDGWTLCERIKAQRPVPVLLLTVRAEQQDIERSKRVGADAHLAKPFDIQEFLACVRNLLLAPARKEC